MLPSGWIFYQTQQLGNDLVRATECWPWNLQFDPQFRCTNIVVSDDKLRATACALIASEKSASFHLNVEQQQLFGGAIFSTSFKQGHLILIFDNAALAQGAQARDYFNDRILPFLQREPDEPLNQRTKTVVQLTALGFTTKEIAAALFLSSRGVDYHLDLAKKTLGANNKSSLVYLASRQGWFV